MARTTSSPSAAIVREWRSLSISWVRRRQTSGQAARARARSKQTTAARAPGGGSRLHRLAHAARRTQPKQRRAATSPTGVVRVGARLCSAYRVNLHWIGHPAAAGLTGSQQRVLGRTLTGC